MPPPPRLILLSDGSIRVFITMFYVVAIFAVSFQYFSRDDLLQTFEESPVQESQETSTANVHIFRLSADTLSPYLGVSLAQSVPTEVLKKLLPVRLSVAGASCKDAAQAGVLYNGTLLQAPENRLLLIHPVHCKEYILTFTTRSAVVSGTLSLYIESQRGLTAWTSFWVRLIASIFFFLLTLWLALYLMRARSTSGIPMGSRASVIAGASIVCICDPLDLLTCYSTPSFRWYPLRQIGWKLTLWYPLCLISEVMDDLYKQAPPRLESRGRCYLSDSPSYRRSMWQGTLVYLLYLVVDAIWLATMIQSTESLKGDCVNLAESWSVIINRIYRFRWISLDIPGFSFLLWLFVFRIFELIRTLGRFPYSKCRDHSIVASWILLTCSICQFMAAPAMRSFKIARKHFAEDPWFRLNEDLLDLALPGHPSLNIDELVGSALLVLLSVVAFGPHMPSRAPAPPLSVTVTRCPTRMPSMMATMPSMRGSSTMQGRESTRLSLSFGVALSERSMTATPTNEPQISMSPIRRAPSARTWRPTLKNTWFVNRLSSERTIGSSYCSESDDVAVSLSTVRVLAHCSWAVYYESPTQEEFRNPYEDVLECESDLLLSTLSLHHVLHDNDLDVHALVATASFGAEDDNSERAAILAFRGTGSITNVWTDLTMKLIPIESPNMKALAEKRRIEDVLVHEGFQAAFLALKEDLLRILAELDCKTIWITGHSMGGALATLIAVELHLTMPAASIALCTFGSPRVGNGGFVKLFQYSACKSVRVVVDSDPVPSFLSAFRACLHYDHVSGLVRVFQNGHLVVRPSFLEEMLPWLIQHTFVPRILCWFCCFLCRGKEHMLGNYLRALHAAQQLEGCFGCDWAQDPVDLRTSFMQHEPTEALELAQHSKNLMTANGHHGA